MASSGGAEKKWYELAGPGFCIRFTAESGGKRDVVCQTKSGGSVSQSAGTLGGEGTSFSSSNGNISIVGHGKDIFVNGQKLDLTRGRPVTPATTQEGASSGVTSTGTAKTQDTFQRQTSASYTGGMQPMQPMGGMQPMQPMGGMQPMQPMQPMGGMQPMQPMQPMGGMQPMTLSMPGMSMTMGSQGMSATMNGRTMTLPK